jgi:transcriptional regulator with XRE-family HTH domain
MRFMHCGDNLKLLRKYKKLSQTELAKRINRSQEMISYWEQQPHLNGKDLELILSGLNSCKEEWNRFKFFFS